MSCLEKIKDDYECISKKGREKINFNDKYEFDLRKNEKVKAILEEININNADDLLEFGNTSSESVMKTSDELLYSMKNYYEDDINEMLNKLNKVMEDFNFDELKETKETHFLKKIFKINKCELDKQINKSIMIVGEVEKIYLGLKRYEIDLREQLKSMNMLYESNFKYCSSLENYIIASEIILENLDKELSLELGETYSYERVEFLKNNKELLEQKNYDLRTALNISLQNITLMEQIQNYNFDLMELITSSLIITLPIFKRCLTNSIRLKKQEILSMEMNSMQDSTKDFFIKNTVNTSNDNLKTFDSQTDSYSLEQLYKKIMCSIEECKKIKVENKTNIQDNFLKVENLKEKMKFQ
ncbi:toxic anion resistance protein [Clostridioides difficile]|nr:toxic anion resistance protein [Clostridioides difficile]NJI82178.1 toxic anion resistance protein [Clostridioides difficile]